VKRMTPGKERDEQVRCVDGNGDGIHNILGEGGGGQGSSSG